MPSDVHSRELDLRHARGLHVDRMLRRLRVAAEGRVVALLEHLGEAVELGLGEARADAPGVAQAPVLGHADEQRADALATLPSPGSQPPTTTSSRREFLTFSQHGERRPGR